MSSSNYKCNVMRKLSISSSSVQLASDSNSPPRSLGDPCTSSNTRMSGGTGHNDLGLAPARGFGGQKILRLFFRSPEGKRGQLPLDRTAKSLTLPADAPFPSRSPLFSKTLDQPAVYFPARQSSSPSPSRRRSQVQL